jgi:hypothetical protein
VVVACVSSVARTRCEYCAAGNRRAADCRVVGSHSSLTRFADSLQAPPELQEEAASVVALYENFRAREGATMGEVVAAATALVEQFPAANRRAGGLRENPSLGVTSGPGSSTPVPVSDETAQRIASALEAFVALYARVHGEQNPLEEESSGEDDSD